MLEGGTLAVVWAPASVEQASCGSRVFNSGRGKKSEPTDKTDISGISGFFIFIFFIFFYFLIYFLV